MAILKVDPKDRPQQEVEKRTVQADSSYEAPDRDERIVRQGIVQAVVQSPALMAYATDLVEYKKMVVSLANELIDFVWKK